LLAGIRAIHLAKTGFDWLIANNALIVFYNLRVVAFLVSRLIKVVRKGIDGGLCFFKRVLKHGNKVLKVYKRLVQYVL
jgi:hypothetical protein